MVADDIEVNGQHRAEGLPYDDKKVVGNIPDESDLKVEPGWAANEGLVTAEEAAHDGL